MRAVRLEKDRLEEKARANFRDEHIAEFVSLVTIYATRLDEELSAPRFMLSDLRPLNDAFELTARRAFIEAVRDVWIEAGGGDQIGSYAITSGGCRGPLLELVCYLLRSTPRAGMCGESTIHHDIVFIATGRERDHGH